MIDMSRKIVAHCDGGCRNNQEVENVGGFGVVARSFEDEKHVKTMEFGDGVRNTTNNIMELTGAIKTLELLVPFHGKVDIEVHIDSSYVINGMNQWVDGWIKRNWKKADKKPVANKELWKRLVELSKSSKAKFIKTKGHADDEWNNRADELANEAMDRIEEEDDE